MTRRASPCPASGCRPPASGVAASAASTATEQPSTTKGRGSSARCFQHELDHLNGKLFPDLHPVGVRKRLEREAVELPWSGLEALDPRSRLYQGLPEQPEGSD